MQLGWLILDSVGFERTSFLATTLQCTPLDELTALVQYFWEQMESTRPVLSLSQQRTAGVKCTYTPDPSGRYIMRFSARDEIPNLLSTWRSASWMIDAMGRCF